MSFEEIDELFNAVKKKKEHKENLNWMNKMNNYNLDDVFNDTVNGDAVTELIRYIIKEYK